MKIRSSLVRIVFVALAWLALFARPVFGQAGPSLEISNNAAGANISWTDSTFGLQWSIGAISSSGWQLYPTLPLLNGGTRFIFIPASNTAAFFRLVSMSQPAVTSLTASNIACDSVALSGNIHPNNDISTSAEFEYGLTTNYGSSTVPVVIGGAPHVFSLPITNLFPSTTYHFRIDAANSQGATNGTDLTFTTGAVRVGQARPTLSTAGALFVTTNTAFLSANVNDNGANVDVEVYWEYGLTTNYGITTPDGDFASRTQTLLVAESVTNLAPATTYHYRAIAFNNGGTSVGSDISFKTSSP
jgi:hypothetical protein